MGSIVRNLYPIKTASGVRWKYRKVIPERLRSFVDGGVSEFVRWLGQSDGKPSPEVLRKFAEADAECSRLLKLAEKRATGEYDSLDREAIAYLISSARADLLAEDEDERFDESADALFRAVSAELSGSGAHVYLDPERRYRKRGEALEDSLAEWRHDYARGRLSEFVIEEALDRCTGQGLVVDPGDESFRLFARAYLKLLIDVAELGLKRQQGDIVDTPEPPSPRQAQQLRALPKQTITGLVQGWWSEAKPGGLAISTYDAYERSARQFVAFLGHDDASAVSQEDVIRYKEHRLAAGVKPKTVKDSDLSGLRRIFRWGVKNRRIATNPVQDVDVVIPRRTLTRLKGFTDEEAWTLLRHALKHRRAPNEGEKIAAAKRWVPWLCAYTGARVGEMVQLRKEDVKEESGHPVVVITPEAVTVKGGRYRIVPLHPHLIELGFLQFVASSETGFLFLSVTKPGEEGKRGAWRTAKNRVRDFVREVISDPGVQPNHAWRHRMETLGRDLNIRQDTLDAITGHTTRGVSAQYGDHLIRTMADAIAKLPRYEVEAAMPSTP